MGTEWGAGGEGSGSPLLRLGGRDIGAWEDGRSGFELGGSARGDWRTGSRGQLGSVLESWLERAASPSCLESLAWRSRRGTGGAHLEANRRTMC